MFKLIIKNIWSRRKRNAWLLAELIVVAVIAWAVLDPVVVSLHMQRQPRGYDSDRLLIVNLDYESSRSPKYDPTADSIEAKEQAVRQIVNMVAEYPEVELALPIPGGNHPESGGGTWRSFSPNDSIEFSTRVFYYFEGTPFFQAYGIKSIPGSAPVESLEQLPVSGSDIVLCETATRIFFPDGEFLGHYIGETKTDFNKDDAFHVVGAVTDIISESYEGRGVCYYTPASLRSHLYYYCDASVLIRLKPGVSPAEFKNKFRPVIPELRVGNIKATGIQDYEEKIAGNMMRRGYTNEFRLKVALAVFFFVNLCLGVIGTFYLQTRKRSEDAGIMRSFGATPGYIMREMLGEGVVLTTIGWLAGCLIYLQYALKEGLIVTGGQRHSNIAQFMPDWTDNFWIHFSVVSCIIYVILLVTVSIGIYIPSRRISRVKPVDALRDE